MNQKNNARISVKYTKYDENNKSLGKFSCSGEVRMDPLDEETASILAKSLAEKHAGTTNITVDNFSVSELQ